MNDCFHTFLLENMAVWTRFEDMEQGGFYNIFATHQKNPLRFQHFLVDSHYFEMHSKARQNWGRKAVITERSLYTNVYVFIEKLYIDGRIGRLDYLLLKSKSLQYFHLILEEFSFLPFFVLLNDSPSAALQRIKKRGRRGEEKITLSYLEDLQSRYLDLYGEGGEGAEMPFPHVKIDLGKYRDGPFGEIDTKGVIAKINSSLCAQYLKAE